MYIVLTGTIEHRASAQHGSARFNTGIRIVVCLEEGRVDFVETEIGEQTTLYRECCEDGEIDGIYIDAKVEHEPVSRSTFERMVAPLLEKYARQ